MGAPLGNKNAANAKEWRDAIRYALAEAERENKPYKIKELARVMLTKAVEGDMAALRELGDRLDGKPAQTLAGDPDNPLMPQNLSVNFVKPAS